MSYILIFTKGYLLNFSFHYRMRLKKILVCKSCQIHNPFIWYIHRFLLIFFWEGLFKFCINNYRPKYAVHTQIYIHLYTHLSVIRMFCHLPNFLSTEIRLLCVCMPVSITVKVMLYSQIWSQYAFRNVYYIAFWQKNIINYWMESEPPCTMSLTLLINT